MRGTRAEVRGQGSEVSDSFLNRLIAEACPEAVKYDDEVWWFWNSKESFWEPIISPCKDLNAMHEAEKTLGDDTNTLKEEDGYCSEWDQYIMALEAVIAVNEAEDDIYRCSISATARQRAEAFAKVKGLI